MPLKLISKFWRRNIMRHKIENMRRSLERKKGQYNELENSIKRSKKSIEDTQKQLDACQEALIVIQIVAKKTQEHLEVRLSSLVSAGMASVFSDPYQLSVEFLSRRNQVETELNFVRDNRKFIPKKCGGGAQDIASLTLQFSIMAINNPKTRPLMLLDEPLKWLKGKELPQLGAEMIKEISQKLGIQIIMVSHSPELIASADKIFTVEMQDKYSTVIQN